jgi:hypothetical protein
VQVSVCGCEVSLLCVCVYRCVKLKELVVRRCYSVTDVGLRNVITNCIQLRVLNLEGLTDITGMCAVCYNSMLYDILRVGSSLTTKAHHWTIL